MKIKTTILFTTLLTVGAIVGYFPKATTATGSTDNSSKKEYTTSFSIICPVVGTRNAIESTVSIDSNAPIYKHCTKCATGVYLLHKEENQFVHSKCTFCGALEDGEEIGLISGE